MSVIKACGSSCPLARLKGVLFRMYCVIFSFSGCHYWARGGRFSLYLWCSGTKESSLFPYRQWNPSCLGWSLRFGCPKVIGVCLHMFGPYLPPQLRSKLHKAIQKTITGDENTSPFFSQVEYLLLNASATYLIFCYRVRRSIINRCSFKYVLFHVQIQSNVFGSPLQSDVHNLQTKGDQRGRILKIIKLIISTLEQYSLVCVCHPKFPAEKDKREM